MQVNQVGLWVTFIFETEVYEGQSKKCEKHLHKYTNNKTQSSKLMIKMVKTSI
jgi:hypothetical protein